MNNIYEKICPYCKKEKEAYYNPFLKIITYEPCKCEIKKEAEQENKHIAEGRKRLFEVYQTECGIVYANTRKTFKTFDTLNNPERETAKQKATEFADRQDGNLFIIGSVGIGKTHLVASIINRICYNLVYNLTDEEIKSYNQSGIKPKQTPACYIRECDLNNIFPKVRSFNDTTAAQIINKCKSRPLLFIDDIDASKSYSDNDLSVLYDIIDTRYTRELATVITSNYLPEEIKNKIGDRSYDRLKNNADIIKFAGASFRKPSF